MTDPKPISPDFPYDSKFIEVEGEQMHYIEDGEGDPILFLHGNPTSSYLWRNIIPHLRPHGRCIAPDLIGMGRSAKPDIAYRFLDHYRFVKGFIEGMELDNITLVIHDWGSALGFHYAMQHEEKIKGIAFMEAILRPARWSEFPADFKTGFKLMRTPYVGWFMISVMNVFVNRILPQATIRKLSEAEMGHYRAPYPSIQSRKPIRQWPCEIPIDGHPADVHQIVSGNSEKLQRSQIPKLLLSFHPGGLIRKEMVEWCKKNLPNLTEVHIGKGLHYVQEDHPHEIGEAIAEWYGDLG